MLDVRCPAMDEVRKASGWPSQRRGRRTASRYTHLSSGIEPREGLASEVLELFDVSEES